MELDISKISNGVGYGDNKMLINRHSTSHSLRTYFDFDLFLKVNIKNIWGTRYRTPHYFNFSLLPLIFIKQSAHRKHTDKN